MKHAFPIFLMILPVAAGGVEPTAGTVPPRLTLAYPELSFDDNATAVATLPDRTMRSVVGFQRGQIRILPVDRNASEALMFLDLREKLKSDTGFEEGLHGLAFHPQFESHPLVYLSYSQQEPRRTVLSEFRVSTGDHPQADPSSERILLDLPQPLGNHWGGGLVFGTDGFLYLALGDGGMRDDPYRLSQNLWSLHGKVLRLDVNGSGPGTAYGIPADNPYVDVQEIRSEIWASGFRNPWGFSFDPASGTLWCGDVGQDTWEEVNLVTKAGNYGWSEREGPARFVTRAKSPAEGGPFTDPIHSYGRTEGVSVTGGFVYQGTRLPSLQGKYLFGDWGSGKLWTLAWDTGAHTSSGVTQIHPNAMSGKLKFNPTVIGADASGEPLIFSHSPSLIYTLEPAQLLADVEEAAEMTADPLPSPERSPDSPDFSLDDEPS